MEGQDDRGDRRQRTDRRTHGAAEERRGSDPRATSPLMLILRSLGALVVLVLVIIFAVRQTRPVFATRGTLGDELRRRAPEAALAIGAFDSTNVDKLMATPKFQEEKRNFYEDVMRLKQVDSARADSIAQFAVREAYVRGISPALIFGVMLTENAKFISKAQSNVGAVGLMQVYPKVWLTKEMTALFGRDLATDSTNVKYGVFILSHYFNPKVKGGGTRERDWATALLRYNGCVRGTNTPRCHTYPNKVQGFVEKQATSICNGRGFYQCIAKPFVEGLFTGGKLTPDTPKVAPTGATPTGATPTPSGMVVMPAAVVYAPPPPASMSIKGRATEAAAKSAAASKAKSVAAKKKKPVAKPRSRRPLPPIRRTSP